MRNKMISGDKSDMPGLMRASFGMYNTIDDVDALAEALLRISQGDYHGKYIQDGTTGEFTPRDWEPDYEKYFSLGGME